MNTINLEKHQKDFLENLADQGKSFNTIKNYKTDLNIFNKYLIAKGRSLEIKGLSLEEVKEYGAYLEKTYNSPNSIRRRVQALRIFFDYLISLKMLDENPVKKMLVSPKVVDLPKPAPFSAVRKLKKELFLQTKNGNDHEKLLAARNLILFDLIYHGGLKVSDVERLNNKHLYTTKEDVRVIITPDKRDPYTISLPEQIDSNIKNYKKKLEQGKNRDQIEFDQLLFNANPFKILNGGLSSRGIEILFKDFSKLAGTAMTAKSLRQACIFKWLAQDINHARIKEWMGVQPQYSLKPFVDLMENKPSEYLYLEVHCEE